MVLKSAPFAAASAAAWTKGSYRRDKYNRLRARRGPVRAIMAVARKRSTAKLVQRLSNLGYDVMLVPKAA